MLWNNLSFIMVKWNDPHLDPVVLWNEVVLFLPPISPQPLVTQWSVLHNNNTCVQCLPGSGIDVGNTGHPLGVVDVFPRVWT